MNEITRYDFIKAFTARPEDAEAMPMSELLQRLDIILTQFKADIAARDKRTSVSAANCLRGALIRCTQALNDPEVTAKVNELIALTTSVMPYPRK
jgi:hypothetical protein